MQTLPRAPGCGYVALPLHSEWFRMHFADIASSQIPGSFRFQLAFVGTGRNDDAVARGRPAMLRLSNVRFTTWSVPTTKSGTDRAGAFEPNSEWYARFAHRNRQATSADDAGRIGCLGLRAAIAIRLERSGPHSGHNPGRG